MSELGFSLGKEGSKSLEVQVTRALATTGHKAKRVRQVGDGPLCPQCRVLALLTGLVLDRGVCAWLKVELPKTSPG